jgi:hypothetical protein
VARSCGHEARDRVEPKKERIRPIIARLKAAHPDAKAFPDGNRSPGSPYVVRVAL